MKTFSCIVGALAIATLASGPALAGTGFHVGVARGTSPGATCVEPLGPDQAELFAQDLQPGGRLYSAIDGSSDGILVDWDAATGAWHVVGSGGNLALTITHYPLTSVAPMTEHHGMLLLDSEVPEGDAFLESNIAVEIPTPVVRQAPGSNDVSWPALPLAGSSGACQRAGETADPVVVAWNVYRLLRSDVPPAFSTPEHYLCGADLDCATSVDNGFVASVPNVPDAIDGLVHFADGALSSDPALADFVYVVQPIQAGAPTGDADGDTVPDEDLSSDGIPEFVDPSNTGRGLTGRVDGPGGFTKPILISTDSFTTRGVRLFIRERPGGYTVEWDPVGAGVAPLGLDFHGGMLSDVRDPVAFAARDRLACGWPDGPNAMPLVDPGFGAGNRYYLLSVAFPLADGRVVEEYGSDSFGRERPATTTPPPCR